MKHAALVLAHGNWNILRLLMRQLQDEDVDIFLHIDKKSIDSFPRDDFNDLSFIQIESCYIGYADYTHLEALYNLIRRAYDFGRYDYYHVISGADMMLVPIEKFLNFFEEHAGKEFVGFSDKDFESAWIYRHYFIRASREKNILKRCILKVIRRIVRSVQEILGIKNKLPLIFGEVKKGSDWWSVTDEAIELILEKEETFKKCFHRAYAPTEFLAQTVIWNSPLRENLYGLKVGSNMREIDWTRPADPKNPGGPHVYDMSDFDMLRKSDKLFARKFDEKIDYEIVEAIYRYTTQ